jgi:hypothetical protein
MKEGATGWKVEGHNGFTKRSQEVIYYQQKQRKAEVAS